jgi:hypothetical protein
MSFEKIVTLESIGEVLVSTVQLPTGAWETALFWPVGASVERSLVVGRYANRMQAIHGHVRHGTSEAVARAVATA